MGWGTTWALGFKPFPVILMYSLGTTEKPRTQGGAAAFEELERNRGSLNLRTCIPAKAPGHGRHLQCTEVKALRNRALDALLASETYLVTQTEHDLGSHQLPPPAPILTKLKYTGTKFVPVSQGQKIFPDALCALNH